MSDSGKNAVERQISRQPVIHFPTFNAQVQKYHHTQNGKSHHGTSTQRITGTIAITYRNQIMGERRFSVTNLLIQRGQAGEPRRERMKEPELGREERLLHSFGWGRKGDLVRRHGEEKDACLKEREPTLRSYILPLTILLSLNIKFFFFFLIK